MSADAHDGRIGGVIGQTGRIARAPSVGRQYVWDLPLRLFHWLLVAAVTTAIVSGRIGGDLMVWHGRAGYAILGLLAFRLVWGVVGPRHARFSSFWPSPARLRAYLSGRWHGAGHNPLGALSVFALLGLLTVQAASGLCANDDIAFAGPLASWIGDEGSASLTALHHRLAALLYGLLGLHIAAILFYLLIKRRNLVTPMITGWASRPSAGAVPPAVVGEAAVPVRTAPAWRDESRAA